MEKTEKKVEKIQENISIYIPEEMREEIPRQANKENRNISNFIINCVKFYLAQKK